MIQRGLCPLMPTQVLEFDGRQVTPTDAHIAQMLREGAGNVQGSGLSGFSDDYCNDGGPFSPLFFVGHGPYWGRASYGAKADKYRELFKTNTPQEVPSAAQSNGYRADANIP